MGRFSYTNRHKFQFTGLQLGDIDRVRDALFNRGKVSDYYADYQTSQGWMIIATDLNRSEMLQMFRGLGLKAS